MIINELFSTRAKLYPLDEDWKISLEKNQQTVVDFILEDPDHDFIPFSNLEGDRIYDGQYRVFKNGIDVTSQITNLTFNIEYITEEVANYRFHVLYNGSSKITKDKYTLELISGNVVQLSSFVTISVGYSEINDKYPDLNPNIDIESQIFLIDDDYDKINLYDKTIDQPNDKIIKIPSNHGQVLVSNIGTNEKIVEIFNVTNQNNQTLEWNIANNAYIADAHYPQEIIFLQNHTQFPGFLDGGTNGFAVQFHDYTTGTGNNNNAFSINDNVTSNLFQNNNSTVKNIHSISMGSGNDILDISSKTTFVSDNGIVNINLGDGNDTFFSGGISGTVNVMGGLGSDRIICGPNTTEIIKYNSIIESSGVNIDTISYFNTEIDKIDLKNIANISSSTIYFYQQNTNGSLEIDLNKDGIIDMKVNFTNIIGDILPNEENILIIN